MIKILKESKRVDCFQNSTGSSFYDGIMDNSPLNGKSRYTTAEYYRFEKGIEGKIVYMTCDEYIQHCVDDIFHSSTESVLRGIDWDNVKKYAQMMKDGTKFKLPYLCISEEYGQGQEGRHRFLAVKEAFGKDAEAACLVCKDSKPTEDEIKDYAKKKYPEHPEWIIDSLMNAFYGEDSDEDESDDYSLYTATLIGEGDIIDVGDGKCTVDAIDLKSYSIVFYCSLLDSGKEVTYELDDDDEVKCYES